MNIKVITGQQGSDIENSVYKFKGSIILFPETQQCHSYDLCEDVMRTVQKSFDSDRDLIIATYSEIVLDAVCLWVARNSFENAECINVLSDGSIVNVPINKNGELDRWIDGVFDIKMLILRELFEIRRSRRKQ